jgi:hypothetical protein
MVTLLPQLLFLLHINIQNQKKVNYKMKVTEGIFFQFILFQIVFKKLLILVNRFL